MICEGAKDEIGIYKGGLCEGVICVAAKSEGTLCDGAY